MQSLSTGPNAEKLWLWGHFLFTAYLWNENLQAALKAYSLSLQFEFDRKALVKLYVLKLESLESLRKELNLYSRAEPSFPMCDSNDYTY